MRKYSNGIALLHTMFSCFLGAHPGNYTSRIQKLIHVIETKGPQKIDKYQTKVLEEIKKQ